MPHLNTEPGQYDITASAYVVRLDTPEPTLMLHWHQLLKKYMQFGGHIERDENLWQTLIRELADESGYEIDQLKILQPKSRIKQLTGAQLHPEPAVMVSCQFGDMDHYHTDIAFALVTDQKPAHSVADGESDEMRLFTAAQLRELDNAHIIEDVREIGLFILEQCLQEWTPVSVAEWENKF